METPSLGPGALFWSRIFDQNPTVTFGPSTPSAKQGEGGEDALANALALPAWHTWPGHPALRRWLNRAACCGSSHRVPSGTGRIQGRLEAQGFF